MHLFIAIFLVACNQAVKQDSVQKQEEQVVKDTIAEYNDSFESLDSKLILTRLFDNPEIDSTGAALWIPNYGDAVKLSRFTSYDGKCHTNVDTILYFKDHRNEECAAVIFTHYKYERDFQDSTQIFISGWYLTPVPLGIALFIKPKNEQWQIYCFEKFFSNLGSFGTYRTGREDEGKISLKKIGDNWTCLSLRQGIGGSAGAISGYESLYSIEMHQFYNQQDEEEITEWYDEWRLQNMLTYSYYSSRPDGDNDIVITTELKIIPKKNDYYGIELTIQKKGKTSTEKYSYSERYGKYIQKE